MLESGMRIVVMPAAERVRAVARPEKLRKEGQELAREGREIVRRGGLGDDDCKLAFPRGGFEECFHCS